MGLDLKYQWLQASRVSSKKRCQVNEIMQVPCVKISVEDRAQDLSDRFSVEAAVQDRCVTLPVQHAHGRSAQKIFARDLRVRYLCSGYFHPSIHPSIHPLPSVLFHSITKHIMPNHTMQYHTITYLYAAIHTLHCMTLHDMTLHDITLHYMA